MPSENKLALPLPGKFCKQVLLLVGALLSLLSLPQLSQAAEEAAAGNAGAAMDQLMQEPEIGYYEMKPDFVTNLASTAGGKLHYIRISVSLMLTDSQDLELMKQKDPLLRDCIVAQLGAKDYGAVSTAEGREALRQEIRKRLQELINQPAERKVIADVLFTNYIFQ